MALIESVPAIKLVPNTQTDNANTNMSGVVNATVIQDFKTNFC